MRSTKLHGYINSITLVSLSFGCHCHAASHYRYGATRGVTVVVVWIRHDATRVGLVDLLTCVMCLDGGLLRSIALLVHAPCHTVVPWVTSTTPWVISKDRLSTWWSVWTMLSVNYPYDMPAWSTRQDENAVMSSRLWTACDASNLYREGPVVDALRTRWLQPGQDDKGGCSCWSSKGISRT